MWSNKGKKERKKTFFLFIEENRIDNQIFMGKYQNVTTIIERNCKRKYSKRGETSDDIDLKNDECKRLKAIEWETESN